MPISIIFGYKWDRFCMRISSFSAHHTYITTKRATGESVLPEPSELCYSYKIIPSYEGYTHRSNVCKMIQKFGTIKQLGILLSRGRKQILSSSIENVATTVIISP